MNRNGPYSSVIVAKKKSTPIIGIKMSVVSGRRNSVGLRINFANIAQGNNKIAKTNEIVKKFSDRSLPTLNVIFVNTATHPKAIIMQITSKTLKPNGALLNLFTLKSHGNFTAICIRKFYGITKIQPKRQVHEQLQLERIALPLSRNPSD